MFVKCFQDFLNYCRNLIIKKKIVKIRDLNAPFIIASETLRKNVILFSLKPIRNDGL